MRYFVVGIGVFLGLIGAYFLHKYLYSDGTAYGLMDIRDTAQKKRDEALEKKQGNTMEKGKKH